MSPNRFCPQCGNPTDMDTRFCGNCGAPLSAQQPQSPPPAYPAPPPSSYPAQPPSSYPAPQPSSYPAPQPARQDQPGYPPTGSSPGAVHAIGNARTRGSRTGVKKKTPLIVVIISILMILYALVPPFLLVAGTSTQGTITDTEQIVNANSERMDYNYDVSFRFVDSNGAQIQSSWRMNRVYDIRKLPRVGSSVKVRYFPAFSRINMPDRPGSYLGSLVFGGLGIGLLVFSGGMSVKKKK